MHAQMQIRDLEKRFGPVKHVILPSAALEHKVLAGPFARKFSKSQLWVTPNQYSFPFGMYLSMHVLLCPLSESETLTKKKKHASKRHALK
jgi:hypothetical protein